MNIEIVLTPTTGSIDELRPGFVRGLPPGECVTVRAELRDSRDLLWRSHRALSAGRDGVAKMDADELIAPLTLSPNVVRRPGQATANRAGWLEAVAFLRESLAGSLAIAEATTTEGSPCR